MFGDTGDGCGQCGIFGILGVLGDGSYALCGIGETVPELVFGHADRDRLEDVWNGNPVLQELREGLPSRLQGICGECLMKSVCLGELYCPEFLSLQESLGAQLVLRGGCKAGSFPEYPALCTTVTRQLSREDVVDGKFAASYSKPVIVDLDDPDQFAAGGGCNTGSSPQGGQCHPTGGVANNRCSYGFHCQHLWSGDNCLLKWQACNSLR